MNLKQFLKNIILLAGKMALEYQSRLAELTVERKSTTQLVTEADGRCSDFSGNTQNFYREFVATNGKIHHDLITILASA